MKASAAAASVAGATDAQGAQGGAANGASGAASWRHAAARVVTVSEGCGGEGTRVARGARVEGVLVTT